MDKPTTDRERLALAFDDLRQRGYLAPVEFAWTQCCRNCAAAELDRLDPSGAARGFVFWDAQDDDAAFIEPDGQPLPERFAGRDDDWLNDPANGPEIEAACLDERLHRWTNLRRPLRLKWGGDRYTIVRTLRRHGLHAKLPPDPETCIEVLPRRVVRA
jgi:hypothetical protein